MLRLAVALLLVANAAFYAWSQGWLDDLIGVRAQGEREPQRLQRQVNPQSLRLLPASAASALLSRRAAQACLEAGPFAASELPRVQQLLASVPARQVSLVTLERPGRWIVYMGRFASREQLDEKIEQVRRLRLPFAEISGAPSYEPGLVLGRFDGPDAAEQALARLVERGVRTARVVELEAPTLLRVTGVDAALRQQLGALNPALLRGGWAPCGAAR